MENIYYAHFLKYRLVNFRLIDYFVFYLELIIGC